MKTEFKLIAHFPNLKAGKTKTKAVGIVENDKIIEFYSRDDQIEGVWLKNKTWTWARNYFLYQRKYEIREKVIREND